MYQDTDHNVIFTERFNRVRTVGVDQEYLVFFQDHRFSVNVLRTFAGIYIVDLNVGMDMLRDWIKPGIPFDRNILKAHRNIKKIRRYGIFTVHGTEERIIKVHTVNFSSVDHHFGQGIPSVEAVTGLIVLFTV